MAWVATAVIGAGLIGAGATAYAANTAANAQENAANTAANTSLDMYNTTAANLAPYRNIGNTAATQLTSSLPDLTTPITMDQSTVEKTPGYQFNLTQGLKAAQNSAAARGLGTSGAALKGATTFATGLADSTYQNQFNNANTNQTNAYNRLSGLVNTGENAAAGTGSAGTAAANTAASAAIAGGNAAAAGANATGGAVSSLANTVSGYAAAQGLYGTNYTNANGSIAGAVGPTSVGGAPLVYSDERLKDNVVSIGALTDGTPLYKYSYKFDPTKQKHIGVMAQDILKRRPEAVVKTSSGYLAVDYDKATNVKPLKKLVA